MRKLHRLAWLSVPAMAVACTSLLGDFTVGSGGDAGDAGDAQNINDVATDTPTDGPVFQSLTCNEVNGGRLAVTKSLALHSNAVRMSTIGNQKFRMVLADYPQVDGGQSPFAIVQAYTFDAKNQSNGFVANPLQTSAFNVLSIARYPGPKPGFAVLYKQYDQSSNVSYLTAARFPDDATDWSPPVTLVNLGTGGSGNDSATFIVTDPPNDGYYIAYSTTTGTKQTIQAGDVHAGGSLPTIASFDVSAESYSFTDPSIAQHGPQTFIMMSGNTNGPPPPGLPSIMLVPGQQTVTIQPPSNINWFPVAFSNSVDPLKTNAAFLVADLSTSTGSYRVGQFPFTSLGTVDPTALASTVPPVGDAGSTSLKDLFLNSGSAHWEVPPLNTSEQLLMTSPPADPVLSILYPGLNFAWWDGPTGTSRAYRSGANALLTDLPYVLGADAAMQTLVSGSIAQIYIAYLSTPNQPSKQGGQYNACDLFLTSVGCQKAQ